MKVLVAIDNRPTSQAIVDALIKMRWVVGTEIVLLTVLEDGADVQGSPEMENTAVELRSYLRDCEVTFFARAGHPQTFINDFAEHIGADLIITGSNCKSNLERLLLGSVSQSVINQARCPVLVAKTPCSLAGEASPGFRNILVTIDNSAFSDIVVRWLSNFEWRPEARFIVAAAVDDDVDFEAVRQSLNVRASSLGRLLNTKNVITEIATGNAHDSIIYLAEQFYADLIVLGSHGHAGLKELILGSVSQAVSHSAQCAVAIVREANVNEEAMGTSAFAKAKRMTRNDDDKRGTSVHGVPGGF